MELENSIAATLDAVWGALVLPLTGWILLSGLDDVVLVAAAAAAWVRRRFGRPPQEPLREFLCSEPQKRMAIVVPLWREHDVIGRMVEHNLAAIRYSTYELFIGAYPNDEPTLDAVRDLESRFSRVHLAVCPHDGPTSKADCLHWALERLRRYEQETASRFDAVVTHDAEDVIHPDSLLWINHYAGAYDMVQVPVLPLPTRFSEFTHGVYCDEFAEYQMKDIPIRGIFGGFIPSNGVGTGYTRRALDRLAAAHGGRAFAAGCLTEDYENGLQLGLAGYPQIFVDSMLRLNPPAATREYFPRHMADAVRQRARWVAGIALQGWAHHGWRGGLRQIYWLWRDRKGLLGNLLTVIANLMFAWGVFRWLESRWSGQTWSLATAIPPLAAYVAPATLALPVIHLGVRMLCACRLYGWRHAAGVPARSLWANWINFAATVRAVWNYAAARLRRRALTWQKTEHAYPSRETLRPAPARLGEILIGMGIIGSGDLHRALESCSPGIRLGQHLKALGLVDEGTVYRALSLQSGLPHGYISPWQVERVAARSLPAWLARRWRLLPYRIAAGHLFLAGPYAPTDACRVELRRFTRLDTRFQLVTESNYSELERAAQVA